MKDLLNRDEHTPVYNIKAVSRLTGLPSVTLRAWERRYGLPSPRRGHQGYRLYSEYDLRILQWLKMQLDNGLSIGRAVEYLNELRNNGQDPAKDDAHPLVSDRVSLPELVKQLYHCLIHFDETGAVDVMRRSFALFSFDQVLTGIVQPVMIEIGDAWHRGEIPIAAEHFATQFCIQHLMNIIAVSTPAIHPGIIVAACAPGEMHQLGLLMIVAMLRWRGWNVKYLGPDLSLSGMESVMLQLKPRLLLFSATRLEAAKALEQLPEVLSKLSAPYPKVVLGGQAFRDFRLSSLADAIYLDVSPVSVVSMIEHLMSQPAT